MSNAQIESVENNENEEEEDEMPVGCSIEDFFAASVIFITGATGFLGKALLEKLLRSCQQISIIYILIRPKRNFTVQQRLKNLLENPVFERIRWECPSAFDKIVAVKGDVSQPKLGLSEEDRLMLIQNVNIVFHSAATVRFDEPLKVAVNLNTQGTARVIELCSNMMNLISLVHVSTAYSNADLTEIKEKVYSGVIEPEVAIEMCESLNDDTLKVLEQKLKGKHPNTYTLTKGLAENIVIKKGAGLPIAIVRPSIVCAACNEPFPGWVDNVCGITGIMMEIFRGTIRSILCNQKLVVDVVPVDFVVDTLICSAWHCAIRRSNNIKIYNCTSGTYNPIKWKELGNLITKYATESPTKYVVWYPGFTFRTNKIIHKLLVAILHFLPAFIIDLVLKFLGGKPVMMKITKRFDRAAKTGEFFTVNEWKFSGDNMKVLSKHVKAAIDAKYFNVDIMTLDWETYVQKYMLGIRKYILKDNPESITKARIKLSKLYWLQKCLQAFVILSMWKVISNR